MGYMLLATSPGPLRRFNLAHPKVLILQERLFCFCLSLLNRNSRRSCGNVGIAAAISKGGGKGGKPAFGFPGFPPPGISTAAWSRRLGSFLLFLRGPAESIRLGPRFEDVSAVGDAVQQRFAEKRIRDNLSPLTAAKMRDLAEGGYIRHIE